METVAIQTTVGKLEADLRRAGVWLTVVGIAGYFIQGVFTGLYLGAFGLAAWGGAFLLTFRMKRALDKRKLKEQHPHHEQG